MGEPVRWSHQAQEVISGDITTAAAYLTPAAGAVVTAVPTYAHDAGGGRPCHVAGRARRVRVREKARTREGDAAAAAWPPAAAGDRGHGRSAERHAQSSAAAAGGQRCPGTRQRRSSRAVVSSGCRTLRRSVRGRAQLRPRRAP